VEHLFPLLLVVGSYRAGGLWPKPLLHLLYGCVGAAVFILLGIQYGSGRFYAPLLPQGTDRLAPVVLNAAAYAVLIGLLCRWAARHGAHRGPDG